MLCNLTATQMVHIFFNGNVAKTGEQNWNFFKHINPFEGSDERQNQINYASLRCITKVFGAVVDN